MMESDKIYSVLQDIFQDTTLFGFCDIEHSLKEEYNCKCAVVTLLPYKDFDYIYNPIEFYAMLEDLRKEHSIKLSKFKSFLDTNSIKYVSPPATPKDDEHLALFSYKWAAINSGLGFIGKNDVFVHYKYAQRVRISCLLIECELPVFRGKVYNLCGDCHQCVDSCPHQLINGVNWHIDIHRDELLDYKKCAKMSNHSGKEPHYLCAYCALACKYPNIQL